MGLKDPYFGLYGWACFGLSKRDGPNLTANDFVRKIL